MIDAVKHILANDTAVTAIVPANRMTANERVQGAALPAIMLDLVSTDDFYCLGQFEDVSEYTFDIVGYTAGYAQAHQLMDAIRSAIGFYKGSITTSEGNTYTVVATEIVNRDIDKDSGLDAIETTVTVEVMIQHTAS